MVVCNMLWIVYDGSKNILGANDMWVSFDNFLNFSPKVPKIGA